MTRKSVAIVAGLLAANVVLLVVGHAMAPERAQRGGTGGRVRVGLVFDVGGLGDESFNDAAYRGLLQAERDLGATVQYIEPGDGSDRESALRQLASRGLDLVIGVGFIFSADLDKLAKAFPDVRFAGIDYSPSGDGTTAENLAGVRFREHEGSFVVGAIAGMVTKTRKVGFVGGMKIPLIGKFEAGFRAGVLHVCSDCTVMVAYAGTDPKAFADPTTGRELASTQYGRGADIVYHASGKTGAGVFAAAREQGALAIGVDSNQFGEAPCCVLTSMLKRVDVAVVDVIRAVRDGTFRGGVTELGLADDGVGFVADDDNRDRLPADVVDRARALAKQIIAGEIAVPSQ
jgi:basic membrane protein A